jgi:hypothetical protein
MANFKGRALIYPLLLVATWVVARSLNHSPVEVSGALAKAAEPQWTSASGAAPIASYCPGLQSFGDAPYAAASAPSPFQQQPDFIYAPRFYAPFARPSAGKAGGFGTRAENRWLPNLAFDLGDIPQTYPGPAPGAAQHSSGPSKTPMPSRRFQLYAYNFWRQGRGGGGLAPGAQYGGTQAGAIATWDPFGKSGSGPAILLRASTAPNSFEREVAVGTRWKPDANVPISLSLERRFRFGAPDSFAAYAAGGVNKVPLTGKLTFDAYGQAGYALGGGSSYFFDAQGRVMHPLFDLAGMPIELGAGGWAGGQRGVRRFDIGPSLSADVKTKLADFKVYLDWRRRMAGNAAPPDGLALTVAAGF